MTTEQEIEEQFRQDTENEIHVMTMDAIREEEESVVVQDAGRMIEGGNFGEPVPVMGLSTEVEVPITVAEQESVTKRLVAPHTVKSREVKEEDLDLVAKEAAIMYQLCFEPIGMYMGAFAIHHSQIDDKDPLNFFVTQGREIIINPEITRHSSYMKDSKEACVTFPKNPQIMVKRWQKIVAKFKTIMVDKENEGKFKLSSEITEDISGPRAFEFQHEIDHGKAIYIYELF